MHARRSATHPAPCRARRAAARQAAGLVEQRRAAEGQAPAARREGRPHRHARPAGHRAAAAVLRRGHQVLAGQPGRRQGLPRHAAAWASARAPATAKARSSRARRSQVDRAAIEAACARFTGAIDQLPPMHSALKHEGRALYEYARAGIEVERAAAPRDDSRASTSSTGRMPTLVIDVRCSKGTYIRTLAEDIGAGAGLRRAPGGAAPHRQRRADAGRRRHARSAGRAGRSRARRAAAAAPTRCWPTGPRCACPTTRPAASSPACAAASPLADAPRRARLRPASPRAFLGSAHITAGELIADRLLSPLEVQASQA